MLEPLYTVGLFVRAANTTFTDTSIYNRRLRFPKNSIYIVLSLIPLPTLVFQVCQESNGCSISRCHRHQPTWLSGSLLWEDIFLGKPGLMTLRSSLVVHGVSYIKDSPLYLRGRTYWQPAEPLKFSFFTSLN